MSNLEKYIIKRYGRFVPFTTASWELGFDVLQAVACVVTKTGHISMKKEYYFPQGDRMILPHKLKSTKYTYAVPVMSSSSVRGDSIHYKELAHLLNLNMHLQGLQHEEG